MDEQIRMENLKKLSMGKGRGGKSTKSRNMKSPKPGKGKKPTTWDPVLSGGKVNKEEAKMLDRTVGKPEDQDQDNQLIQFVPDLNVVGKSSTLGQVDYESDEEEEEVGLAVKTSTKSGGMFSMFSSLVRFSHRYRYKYKLTQMQRLLIPGWFEAVDKRRSWSSSGKVEGQSYWEERGQ